MATQGSPSFALHDAGSSGSRQPAERRPPAQAPPAKRRALEDLPASAKGTIVNDRYVTNRVGNPICASFNSGTCPGAKKGQVQCAADASRRHNCSKCLSSAHGAHECKETKVAFNKRNPAGKGGKRK